MNIRRAVESDIPDLLRLLVQVCNVHQNIRPDIFQLDGVKYTEPVLRQLLQDDAAPIYAAMEGETLLGYCFCKWKSYHGSTVCTNRKELYIDDLCVDEAHRGQGVASALYRFVRELARQEGCSFVTLNVWSGNEGAMKFYEKMGLRPRSIMMEMPLEDSQC